MVAAPSHHLVASIELSLVHNLARPAPTGGELAAQVHGGEGAAPKHSQRLEVSAQALARLPAQGLLEEFLFAVVRLEDTVEGGC